MNRRSTSWHEAASTPPPKIMDESVALQRATSSKVNSTPPYRKSPSFNRKASSIGSNWTVTLTRLRFAGSYFEAVECLREVREMLSMIDRRDRLKFCKNDYDGAIEELRKQRQFWSSDLFKECVQITLDFFDINPFNKLPLVIHQELLLWLPVQEFAQYASVSREWKEVVASNIIWTTLYYSKFLGNNPGSLPANMNRQSCFIDAFRDRLVDPHLGDKVEVSWKGKFRLETQDVYQGVAWWVAEIVDKHRSQERYKIHYPGWESRWDEWVPRSRLRWSVQSNILVTIYAGDIVELWCCGQNVPGAWLECKVKKIRGRRYCLGKVLSSGYLWVDRDRLRLVKRGHAVAQNMDPNTPPVGSKDAHKLSRNNRSTSPNNTSSNNLFGSPSPSARRLSQVFFSPLATLSGTFLRGSMTSVTPLTPEMLAGEQQNNGHNNDNNNINNFNNPEDQNLPGTNANHLLLAEQEHALQPVSDGTVAGQCVIS